MYTYKFYCKKCGFYQEFPTKEDCKAEKSIHVCQPRPSEEDQQRKKQENFLHALNQMDLEEMFNDPSQAVFEPYFDEYLQAVSLYGFESEEAKAVVDKYSDNPKASKSFQKLNKLVSKLDG